MEKKGYCLAHEASLIVSNEYIGLLDRDEYNLAVKHVYELIRASCLLFKNQSYATSVFLAITVFEEIAKIKAGHMRSWGDGRKKVKRAKDPLFHHAQKHKITIDSIYLGGDRIANSIGHNRAKEFFSCYESGEYTKLREDSLYFARSVEGLHIPSLSIDATLAAEHLLVAIEIFSDEFWGMTAETSEICDTTNSLYSDVESHLKRD